MADCSLSRLHNTLHNALEGRCYTRLTGTAYSTMNTAFHKPVQHPHAGHKQITGWKSMQHQPW